MVRCIIQLVLLSSLTVLSSFSVAADTVEEKWGVIEGYCFQCHNDEDWAGSIAFNLMSPGNISHDAEIWEEAIRRLRGGLMPPPGNDKPDNNTIAELVAFLENTLDENAAVAPAGRVALHRLNRREYSNAIRDLLDINIEVELLLPVDDLEGHFDNNAGALQVSPAFIDQYLNAARTISQNAVGDRRPIPVMETYGSVADMIISLPPRGTPGTGNQQRHNQGMPFGTRGGMSVEHNFSVDGEYELTIGDLALAREVPNMEFENTVIALLDGVEFFRTNIGGETDHKAIDQEQDDAVARINKRLRKIPFNATAGQHQVTVTFLHRSFAESDERISLSALDGGQDRLHAVHALQVRGPLKVTGMSDSPSRQKIFTCYPREEANETVCAQEIINNLAQRAFRRPLTDEDSSMLQAFYAKSREANDFESSIRDVLSAILVSPHFIYRAEGGSVDGGTLLLNDIELASRLSFFIWSSIPDDELLILASEGKLSDPNVLAEQVGRMLLDPKSSTLVDDFATQWLNLPKLDEIIPDRRLFPSASRFLDPRPLMREELSLFIDSILRSDQSVVRLLDADYTFLNERLAMHYGMEGIKGSRFQKVDLEDYPVRNGLLGKGAILLLTANPNRTSPVLRGAWILDRLLGTPPADPPPNVETDLSAQPGQPPSTLRARLEQHRANPSCFGCHGVMDPLGLALENFNAVGQYREFDRETLTAIDASGVLPDGTPISGPEDLRVALMTRSDEFVQTLTENLMTFALGRVVDYRDMPAIRQIVREAAKDDYRFESIVFQVVSSDAFRMREGSITSTSEGTLQQASL